MRSLANFEASNKRLETAKTKNKKVAEAEAEQQMCSAKFDKLSEVGKQGVLHEEGWGFPFWEGVPHLVAQNLAALFLCTL